MHGEREYGLPDLPEIAYAQEFDGRWGVWIHALPFCISLALSYESKDAAIAHAQGDWKGLLARHPEYAGQDPIIVQLQPKARRPWWARAILASRRWLAQHHHL